MEAIKKRSPYGGVYYTFPDGSRAPAPFRSLRSGQFSRRRRRSSYVFVYYGNTEYLNALKQQDEYIKKHSDMQRQMNLKAIPLRDDRGFCRKVSGSNP